MKFGETWQSISRQPRKIKNDLVHFQTEPHPSLRPGAKRSNFLGSKAPMPATEHIVFLTETSIDASRFGLGSYGVWFVDEVTATISTSLEMDRSTETNLHELPAASAYKDGQLGLACTSSAVSTRRFLPKREPHVADGRIAFWPPLVRWSGRRRFVLRRLFGKLVTMTMRLTKFNRLLPPGGTCTGSFFALTTNILFQKHFYNC